MGTRREFANEFELEAVKLVERVDMRERAPDIAELTSFLSGKFRFLVAPKATGPAAERVIQAVLELDSADDVTDVIRETQAMVRTV